MRKQVLSSLIILITAQLHGQSMAIHNITEKITLILEKGDITQCSTQAIVNAANEQLQGGAGVCDAIFNAAEWHKLQSACNQYPEHNTIRCPTGQARITESFGLKKNGINYIIHAVGPDCRIIHDEQEQDLLLTQTYINALTLAENYTIKSIAFPFISSAIYAFPKERAATIAIKTVLEYAARHTTIASFHFVLFLQEDFDLFCTVLDKFVMSQKV